MSHTTHAGLLAGAAALALTGVGAAGTTTDAGNDELRAQVQELQAKIAELEGRQGDQWLTERRAEEIRGLVQDVLADADTRASLLSTSMQAGYDNGFQLGDANGNFLLQINGQLQTRFIYNNADDPAPDGDDNRWGFENTRTKLWFSGHIVDPSWRYMIEGDFGRMGGFTLLDAYIAHEYADSGLVATIGQFKLPFLREQLVDSRYQQAVERSLFNSLFTVGRSQGIMVSQELDAFRWFASISDGAGQLNTPWNVRDTEFAFTGRAEFLGAGNFGQFNEFRSAPDEEFGLLIGAALHWENGEAGTAANETEIIALTVDGTAKFGGWNLFGAFAWTDMDDDNGLDADAWGVMVQGGYHFTPEWELFGRFEYADLDDFNAEDLSILTVGVNNYLFGAGHSAKWTTDFGYAFDSVQISDTRTGWRVDTDDNDGQFVLRSQVQLAF